MELAQTKADTAKKVQEARDQVSFKMRAEGDQSMISKSLMGPEETLIGVENEYDSLVDMALL